MQCANQIPGGDVHPMDDATTCLSGRHTFCDDCIDLDSDLICSVDGCPNLACTACDPNELPCLECDMRGDDTWLRFCDDHLHDSRFACCAAAAVFTRCEVHREDWGCECGMERCPRCSLKPRCECMAILPMGNGNFVMEARDRPEEP